MLYHIPCLIKGRLWSYGWIYNYLCNRCISPLTLQIQIQLRRGVLDTTCDKVCQSLAAGLWFFPSYSGFRLNVTEILLKVALNTGILSEVNFA
jgi:hypothetical protein